MADFTIVAKLIADASSFAQGVGDAGNALSKLGSTTTERMGAVGKGLTAGLTVPIMGVMGASVKLGSEFDSQMATVQAVTSATGDQFQLLNDTAIKMGNDTRWSALEAGQGMEELARAGFSVDETVQAIPHTLNLATAGAIGLAEASKITAGVMNGYGMEASDAQRISDVLAKTASITGTNISGLGETFKYVGPVAKSAGIKFEETAAAAGILGDNSIEAGQAGRMLREGIMSLAAPTDKQAEALQKMGVSAFDAQGNMLPLKDVIKQMEVGTEGWTQQQKLATLETIFGSSAMTAWAILLENGSDKLDEYTKELEDANGFTQEFADILENTAEGAWLNFISKLQTAMIKIWNVIREGIVPFIKWLAQLVDKFNQADEGTQKLVVAIMLILASIGPVLLIITKLVAGFQALSVVMGALTGPVGAVIAIIGVLVGVFMYLWNTNEGFRDFVVEAWGKIKEAISTAIEFVSETSKAVWGPVSEWFMENQELIKETVSKVWDGIVAVFQYAFGIVSAIFSALIDVVSIVLEGIMITLQFWMQIINGDWEGAWETVKASGEYIWNAITTLFDAFLGILKAIIDPFLQFFGTSWDELWSSAGAVASRVWDWLTGVWDGFVEALQAGWGWLKETLGGTWDTFWEGLKTLASGIWDGIKTAWDTLTQGLTIAWNAFKSILDGSWSTFWDGIKTLAGEIWDTIKEAWERLGEGLQTAWDTAKGLLQTAWDTFWETLSTTTETVWNAIVEKFGEIVGKFKDAWDIAKKALLTAWEDGWNALKKFATELWDSIKIKWDGFIEGIQEGARKVKTFFLGASEDSEQAQQEVAESEKKISASAQQSQTTVGDMVTDVVNQLEKTDTSIMKFLENISTGVSETFNNLAKDVNTFVTDMSTSLTNGMQTMTTISTTGLNAIKQDFQSTFTAIGQLVQTQLNNVKTDVQNSISSISSNVQSGLNSIKSNVQSSLSSMTSQITSFLNATKSNVQSSLSTISSNLNSSMSSITSNVQSSMNTIQSTVRSGFTAVTSAISQSMSQAVSTVSSAMSQAVSAMNSASGQARTAGYNMGVGFQNGLNAMSGSIIATARSIANAAAATMRSALRIHSPSRVLMQIGEYTGEGFIVGLKDMIKPTEKMASRLAEAVLFDGGNDFNNRMMLEAQGSMSHAFSSDKIELGKQSLELNIDVNGRNWRVFVDDITKQQDLNLQLKGV